MGSAKQQRAPWPTPLADVAFHGVVGAYVKAIEEHTEADPAAILIQTLACAGNAIGRGPHFLTEDTRHAANLFVAIVGKTATARKGTSLGRARSLLLSADPTWAKINDGEGGLSTAEGLIYAVRDRRGGDAGVQDKRVLAAMGEFTEVLGRMKREGNALGATLRNAWDGATLRVRTKTEPMTATDAHVSVIAHVTEADLTNVLGDVNVYNGFGNRFLWVMAARARSLPHGGSLGIGDLPEIKDRMNKSIQWARECDRRIEFSERAAERWTHIYDDVGRDKVGRFGAITDRGSAQVRRLALIYAVLDQSELVEERHLDSALEVWRYCEESAAYLFEGAEADPLGDRVCRQLSRREGWVARSILQRAFKGSVPSHALTATVDRLMVSGTIEQRERATSGRTAVEYRLVE